MLFLPQFRIFLFILLWQLFTLPGYLSSGSAASYTFSCSVVCLSVVVCHISALRLNREQRI